LICEKGHHDIAELAKRRLKKYVQGSGHARELMQSVGHHQGTRQASGFRDSIPFVHAIIKDVLVSDPLGGIQKKSRKDINLYLQKAVDAVVANFFDAIDYLRPPQVVHGSEHAQWLNSKIDMFEKRLKNNNWPGIWGKMSSASRYAVSDDKYETQAVQIIDILVKAGADTTQAKDSLRLGIKRFNANYQRTRTDILSGRLPRHNLMITDTTSGDKLSLATEKIKVHYLEFLIRYLDGLASPTKDVS
jgi:hypothetical protein